MAFQGNHLEGNRLRSMGKLAIVPIGLLLLGGMLQAGMQLPDLTALYLVGVAYATYQGGGPAGLITMAAILAFAGTLGSSPALSAPPGPWWLLAVAMGAIVFMVRRPASVRNSPPVAPCSPLLEPSSLLEPSTPEVGSTRDNSRFRRLFDCNMIGYICWHADGSISDANDAFLQMIGYSRQELQTGQLNWRSLTPPEHLQGSARAIQQMQQTATSDPLEKEYFHKDGHRVPILLSGVMLEGYSDRGISIVIDLTERKRAEQALQQSEKRFRQLAETVEDVFWMTDLRTRELLYVSPAYDNIWGRSRQELYRQPQSWMDSIHPADRERVQLAYQEQIARNGLDQEYRVVRPDGSVRWIRDRGFLIRDSGGTVYRAAGIAEDITERQWAQSALEASEAMYRTLSEAIPHFVWSVLPDGRLDYANQLWFDYIGLTIQEVNKQGWQAILHPQDVAVVNGAWRQACRTKVANQLEIRFRRSDGTYRWFLSRVAPLKDANGEVLRWIGTGTDIDERKHYEASLQQRAQELQNQQRWLEDVVNLMPIPVLFIQPGTAQVTFANRAADTLAGGEFPRHHSASEYHKVYYCTDASGDRIPNDKMPGVRVARGESLYGWEMDWHTPLGMRSLIVFADTLPAMHGHPEVCVVAFQDISERKRVEDERKRAEQELEERSQRLTLLYETTRDLLSSDQPLTLVDSVYRRLQNQIGLDIYLNYLVDEEKQMLRLASYQGISQEVAQAIEWLDFGQALCGSAAKSRCQLIQDNVQQSNNPKAALIQSLGIRAYACQPLMSQGRLFGTLSFGSHHRNSFTRDETDLMQALCDQVAVAMEHRELVNSLQQQTAQLAQANRIKDEFLAVLSHELRTPLTPILGWTKLLRERHCDPETTRRALETIERNARLQTQLIEDLLDVSRILRGKLALQMMPVDLKAIIRAAMETVQLAAEAKAVSLEFFPPPGDSLSQTPPLATYPPAEPLLVMGDFNRLQQVIWNLLSNGIKFTPSGGRVTIQLERSLQAGSTNQVEQIQITVKDTGRGISPEFLPHVFDSFRQADSSITRSFGGLGLGLAIVRHLVELHGGTVAASSPGEGQGAIFTVSLPLYQGNNGRTGRSISTRSRGNPLPSPGFPLANTQILVVDDDPDTRQLIAIVLQQTGASVVEAASVQQAQELIQQHFPDLIVSDIGLPVANGYSLLEWLRHQDNSQLCNIPALALTAYASEQDRQRAIAAGFQNHLTKPIDPELLITTVTQLAGSKVGTR